MGNLRIPLIEKEVHSMNREVKTFTKADDGRLSKVIDYGNGSKVEIPINKDGSIKWFDDSALLKSNK